MLLGHQIHINYYFLICHMQFEKMSICNIVKLQQKLHVPRHILTTLHRPVSYHYTRSKDLLNKIGNREIVGYGFNGMECYVDRLDFPFPAIRYKETTPEIMGLREKEKGDWRLLTCAEKKELYRSSFCRTFAEIKAPTYEWMSIVGYMLMFVSLGIWLSIWTRYYVYDPYPITFTRPYKRAQLRRQIELQMNPIFGESSKWDYEKNDWKKKRWWYPENPYEGEDWCTE